MILFDNVTYTYPIQDRPAVADINLRVRPGEIVLCTGASGCGKSTLIRLANGLCPHYFRGSLKGEVLVGGAAHARAEPAGDLAPGRHTFSGPGAAVFCSGR